VEFDDGSIEHMSRRERPQLLLSDGNHGAPLFLSNGVMSGGAQGDSVHTLVQKVASGAAASFSTDFLGPGARPQT
jgi:hypothetical protein